MRGLILSLILFSFLITQPVLAADAGSFLRIGVGARALGMGGAFVALADDPTAIYWNPAGLASLKSGELASMYTNQFGLGAHLSFVAFSQPWGEKKDWAVGIVNLSLGQIPITDLDEHGRPVVIGYTGSSESALLLAYAQTLFRSSLGFTIKGIRQALADESSLGFGIDLGAKVPLFENLSVGAILRTGFVNWSTGEKVVFPAQVILGIAYRPFPKFIVTSDAGLQTGRRMEVHVGAEYWLIPQLALRMGLDKGKLAAGAGFVIKQFKLDYALMFHDLGLSHRLSFGMRF
ncbi:MAG: PorV/PorQ family protein [Candidatus Verstraetearchaeota archaeon]|nr:PorV/PorQ family protein [Candidatus Verstraetearchaeota archaeon]